MGYPTYDTRPSLAELLERTEDLGVARRAVAREGGIRELMGSTGESREICADALDAQLSMTEEAVLDLTEGAPTTLVDALERYGRILVDQGGPLLDEPLERSQVVGDLEAILEYPWPEDEARVRMHERNRSLILNFRTRPDGDLEATIGGNDRLLFSASPKDHPEASLAAIQNACREVHRAVLNRVLADRDHHVQLNAADAAALIRWLQFPNGSCSVGDRLTLDAVQGGGLLVRTRPYFYQRPGPALAQDQDNYDARRRASAGLPWAGKGVPPTDPADLPARFEQLQEIPAETVRRATEPDA